MSRQINTAINVLSLITTAHDGSVISVETHFPESQKEANLIVLNATKAAGGDTKISSHFKVHEAPLKNLVPENARVVVARTFDGGDESGLILIGSEEETNKMATDIIIENNGGKEELLESFGFNENHADELVVILENHPLSSYL